MNKTEKTAFREAIIIVMIMNLSIDIKAELEDGVMIDPEDY